MEEIKKLPAIKGFEKRKKAQPQERYQDNVFKPPFAG